MAEHADALMIMAADKMAELREQVATLTKERDDWKAAYYELRELEQNPPVRREDIR